MADADAAALRRAELSLDGLAIGDAFGEQFFVAPDQAEQAIRLRQVPGDGSAEPWRYTDDTLMAVSVVGSLARFGTINQDCLAADFVARYRMDRGYGPTMHGYLARLREGGDWRVEAPALFGGRGSHGNGAAMRAAPIGAYFAGDVTRTVEQATLSALVTHTNPEGIAGAVAVAAGACLAAGRPGLTGPELLRSSAEATPDSEVRAKLSQAARLDDCSGTLAASVLGNGIRLSAQDTVPYALWCASRSADDFREALWLAVSALGDRDTICAIVGGIVALSAEVGTIPNLWRARREPLPDWMDSPGSS